MFSKRSKRLHATKSERVRETKSEGFAKRFQAKNIEIMRAFEAFDASKENYLDIKTFDYLIDHFEYFECLNVNRSILMIDISRAKLDFEMELPKK